MSAILARLPIPDSSTAAIGPFSPRSTMTFDCMNVFEQWLDKKSVSDNDLKANLSRLTKACLQRLQNMPAEHLLLTLISVSVISQRLHGDNRELVCFLCHITEHFNTEYHSDQFNCLYNDLEWVLQLKSALTSNSSFQDSCKSCYISAKQLYESSFQVNSFVEPQKNIEPAHPWHIHTTSTPKTAIHDWYALCYWIHTVLPTAFSRTETSIAFISRWYASWLSSNQHIGEMAVKASALLSIFEVFDEVADEPQTSGHRLERQNSGLLTNLVRKLRLHESSQAQERSTSPSTSSRTRSISEADRSRPLSISSPSRSCLTTSAGSSPQLPASPVLSRKGSKIMTVSRSGSNEQVRALCQIRRSPIPTSFNEWYTQNQAYTLLKRALESLIDTIAPNDFLTLIQTRYAMQKSEPTSQTFRHSQGVTMSWLSHIDAAEVYLLTQLIDQRKFTHEQLLSFFHILIGLQKEELVDFGTRLNLAETILKRLKDSPIHIQVLKGLFNSLLLLTEQARARNWLEVFQSKLQSIIEGLFQTSWCFDDLAIMDQIYDLVNAVTIGLDITTVHVHEKYFSVLRETLQHTREIQKRRPLIQALIALSSKNASLVDQVIELPTAIFHHGDDPELFIGTIDEFLFPTLSTQTQKDRMYASCIHALYLAICSLKSQDGQKIQTKNSLLKTMMVVYRKITTMDTTTLEHFLELSTGLRFAQSDEEKQIELIISFESGPHPRPKLTTVAR